MAAVGGLLFALALGVTQAQAYSCPDTIGTPTIPSPQYTLTSSGCSAGFVAGGLSSVLINDDGAADSFAQFDNLNGETQFTIQSSVTTGASCVQGDNSIYFGNTTNYKVATGGSASCTTTITLTSGTVLAFTANYNAAVSTTTAVSLTGVTFTPAAPAPTVTGLSVSAGKTSGNVNVTISGTNFDTTAANNTVKFGTSTATIVGSPTATSIVATAPAHAAGVVHVTVTTAAGTSTTSVSDQFTYLDNPTITAAFSPTSIPSGGSSTLTLTIANPNATTLTGVGVAASALPANLSGSSPGTTCSGATATLSSGSLSLSGGTLNGSSSCQVTLTVTSSTPSIYNYTTGVVSAGGPASLSGSTATTPTGLTVVTPVTATQAVASKVLTQNGLAASFTPVTGGGGTAPLSYSVSPALPTGLSMASGSGAITGTPTVASGATTYTVTVTDANSTTATNTFSLTVNGAVTATQAIASKVLTQNTAASFTPVTGGGGTTPLSYSVSPALPSGLSMAAGSGAITGTPTVASGATTYTVTVTDANSATATNTFSLTVNGAVTATQAIASKVLTQNALAASFTPVTGGGGTAPLSYSVSPALPTGLSMAAGSGAITGTPTVASAATTYTVTVTDANSATATNTFSLTVNGAVTATQAIASKVLTQNTAASFTPVTGGGGTTPLSYSVSPALPSGLSMAAGSGAITGTPTVTSAAATYTVTVTDANSATATNTFSLTVNGAVTATQAIASKVLTQNALAASFTPVTGGGGTAPLSYSVSPALPSGLSMAAASGAITGTPSVSSAATTYTVTVTDANNAFATATFSLTVNGAFAATQVIASKILTQNTAAPSFKPVIGGGGTAPLSYSVSPALPTGLSMAPSTGVITGTPSVSSAAATYTVTVTDANSATATATFSLTVNGAVTATQVIASKNLTQNVAATSFTPVAGGGGAAPLSYSVAPALPSGLNMAPATGAITGTPLVTSVTATYTVTVTDTNSATATATFGLTINGAVTATQAIASKVLTQNVAATSFTPVTGAGGAAPLSYLVSPALPSGLSMASATGAITGTPSVGSAATSYTVTVTDASNATATASFSLAVTGAVSVTPAVASKILTQNASVSFTPVTVTGGAGPLSYTISPALPAGLSIAAATGVITGTPTAGASATYTVTVTDANQATATASFSLTINGAVTATQALASKVLTQNVATTSFTPVTGAGGTAPLTYSVSPALPGGLSMASASGAITGTPSASSAAASYTVTVTDANDATASAGFNLAVDAALTTTQAVAAATLVQNAAAAPFTPVTASGGAGALSFALSGGTLPSGLSFSTSSGQIAGTPTATLAATTFTVTVTDQTVPVAQTSSKTFTLTVIAATPTITAISPNTGPTTGGTSVVVTGTNLTGATSVRFGGANATSFIVAGPTRITAVTPAGSLGTVDVTVTTPGGTSAVSSADQFTYAVPADSLRLANLQRTVTPVVAQASGQAIVGAIDRAVSDGFGGAGGPLVSPSGNGVRFNFSADSDEQADASGATNARDPFRSTNNWFESAGRGFAPPRPPRGDGAASSRTSDAFAALGYAEPGKAPPLRAREPREWLGWAEISGATLNRWTSPTAFNAIAAVPTIYGDQVNVIGGLTRLVTPSFLVGALAGWETFDYRSDPIQGRLKGDGWTVGAYSGWKPTSSLRFDAAVAYSGIGYDGTAGTASGSFAGSRFLASGGLTGSFESYGLLIEPSARVYALWEREKAYVDSLGTLLPERTFSTGRASGGVKVAYPLAWSEAVTLSPYAGLYGDYYFNTDDALIAGAAAVQPVFDGWSARAMLGVGAQFAGGGQFSIGGERSGLGGNFGIWTYRARASIPFAAQ